MANYWRKSEANFRDGAMMALANANAARAEGDEAAAQEAERRASSYLRWADQARKSGDKYEVEHERANYAAA